MLQSPLAGKTIGDPNGEFVIAEWKQAGCIDGQPRLLVAPPHSHRDCDEAWYVLEGTLCFEVDGKEFEADAGSSVFVPRGAVHTWWNPNPEPARYLVVMTAKTYRLIQAIHASSVRDLAHMKALFEEHDATLLA